MGIRTARDRFEREEIVEILKRNVALYKDDPEFADYFVALTMYLLDQHYEDDRISPAEPPFPPRAAPQAGHRMDLRSAYLSPSLPEDSTMKPMAPPPAPPPAAPRPVTAPSSPAVPIPPGPGGQRALPVTIRPSAGLPPTQPVPSTNLTPPPPPTAPPGFQQPQAPRPFTVRGGAAGGMGNMPPPPAPSGPASSAAIRKSGIIQVERGPLVTPIPSPGQQHVPAEEGGDSERTKAPPPAGQALGQTKVYRVVRPYKSTTALEVPCSVCGSLVGFGVKQCPGCGHIM